MSNIYILSDKIVEDTISLPLLKIEYLKYTLDLNPYDAIIVTSKNAIYSLESNNLLNTSIPLYSIAKQTSKIAKIHGLNLVFTGTTSHGDSFAKELIPLLQDKKVLYLRGEKIVSNLVNILNSNNIKCDEKIVYKSGCKTITNKPILPANSKIIFSSPSTIECFLKNFKWDKSYKAIAIGNTTAKYFPNYITPYIADKTSLESCVKKAKEV